MFKKLTALFLLTAFTQVYAVTPIVNASALKSELNKSFDELNYKLNVEWDQKDTKVFDQAVKGFEKEIAELQAQGVTNKDLVDHALEKIKDKQVQKDMAELQKVIKENGMTDAEARAFVIQKLSSTYSHGASWSGSRMGIHTALIIGAIILIVIACNHNNDDSTDTTTEPCPPTPPECTPCYPYPDFQTLTSVPVECCEIY